MILISSCLLGFNTKYDGKSNFNEIAAKYTHMGRFIPACPEQLGGLPTPRHPCEIISGTGLEVLLNYGKVLTQEGTDHTSSYINGASEVLNMVRLFPVSAAILKERSPSCGVKEIYDGTFSHKLKHGLGVTTALLVKNKIQVYSEHDLTCELMEILIQRDIAIYSK